jgi:predicted Zn-dependent peptidase
MYHYRIEKGKIPIVFYKNDSNFVSMSFVFKAGSSSETLDEYGIAHFLEHMHFQGTKTKNKKEISRLLATYGQFNAETWYFYTSYYFDCVKSNFDVCFDLLTDCVFNSTFPQEEIDKEKEVVLEEYYMYNNSQTSCFSEFVFKNAFKEEMHDIISDPENISKFSLDKILEFRNRNYTLNNICLVISGNLDFDELVKKVDLIEHNLTEVDTQTVCINQHDNCKFSTTTKKFNQSSYAILLDWIHPSDDSKKIGSIFKACLQQILYDNIRDDLGLCYRVSLESLKDSKNSYMFLSTLTSSKKIQILEQSLNDLFNQIKITGFDDFVLELAKNQYLYNVALLKDRSEITSDYMTNKFVYNQDFESMKKNSNFDTEISVTNNDLICFANKYLNNFKVFEMISEIEGEDDNE